MNEVWITGRFSDVAKAADACRDGTYFVAPMTMDESLPHDTMTEWPGLSFPLAA